jgi:hypothetical protein
VVAVLALTLRRHNREQREHRGRATQGVRATCSLGRRLAAAAAERVRQVQTLVLNESEATAEPALRAALLEVLLVMPVVAVVVLTLGARLVLVALVLMEEVLLRTLAELVATVRTVLVVAARRVVSPQGR